LYSKTRKFIHVLVIYAVELIIICEKNQKNKYYGTSKDTHRTTKEKPNQCDVCEKQFTQSCNVTAHRRTHTGGVA